MRSWQGDTGRVNWEHASWNWNVSRELEEGGPNGLGRGERRGGREEPKEASGDEEEKEQTDDIRGRCLNGTVRYGYGEGTRLPTGQLTQ